MNKSTLLTALLLSMLLLTTTSCLKSDDEDVTYTNDAAITSFTLGTLKRIVTTKSSTGADSTYETTFAASSYKFYLDQVNHEIYNVDSLPMGIDIKKIVCTVQSKNSGIIFIKSMKSDSLAYYSSSDSIDFSEPRRFRIYSAAGTAYQDYTVSVNVHKQDSATFNWNKMAEGTPFMNAQGMRAAAIGSTLWVLAANGSATTAWHSADGIAWQSLEQTFDANAWRNMVAANGKLYVLSGDKLYTIDGENISSTAAPGIESLAAASHRGLYGIKSGRSGIAFFDGKGWTDETLSGDAVLLPTGQTAFSCQPLTTNDSTDVVMFTGMNSETGLMETWEKIDEYEHTARKHEWLHITPEDGFRLPAIDDVTLLDYGGYTLAFGTDASVNHSLFTTYYQSVDKGLTWHSFSDYTLPSAAEFNGVYAATVDARNYIWLFCGGTGQVWRGRLNQLGWTKPNGIFR